MEIKKDKLLKYINTLSEAKVLVIGDLALDEMVYGDTERISREAPVLILQHSHTKYILGGASNAAHNASKINSGKVAVLGVIGDDYQAENLKTAFRMANVNCDFLILDKERKTTTKTRISGTCSNSITQQIVRIDRQTNKFISKETEDKLLFNAEKMIPEYDIIILSDYHIGTITPRVVSGIVSIANKYGKKIVADIQQHFENYKGVYSITPNLPDTQKYLGFFINNKEDFIKAGKKLVEDTNVENILITCGADGMVVLDNKGSYMHIPVFNKSKVFDVTGAGDTVTALYSLALSIGAEPVYAAVIGNVAASIVIKQFGCATTTIQEIIENLPKDIIIEE